MTKITKHKTKLKKTETDSYSSADNKSGESPMSNSSLSSVQLAKSPSLPGDMTSGSSHPSISRSSSICNDWLVTDIQVMMFGFGDCRKPLLESAKLIECILRQQMSSLLCQTADCANQRGARFIGLEDILFCMRKDKVKLSRLLKYICHKDLKSSVNATVKSTADEETAQQTENLVDSDISNTKGKLRKLCEKFLSTIDQTGELVALLDDGPFDEIKQERYLRAYHYSSTMDNTLYMEYSEAKSTSFSNKLRFGKFREWLLQDLSPNDLKPNSLALEIFSYLAYETIAQVVDLSLLVKQDANSSSEDASLRGMPPTYYNQDYPCVQAPLQKPNCTSPSLESPTPSTNAISPPPSPTSQAGTSLTSNDTTVRQGISKPNGEKRKRSGTSINFEIPVTQAIQPSDIQEAIRRYYQFQTGPMAPFSKVYTMPFSRKHLCC